MQIMPCIKGENDMELMQRFKSGVVIASDSFFILWRNPALLTYFGIATFIKIIVSILTTAYSWYQYNACVHFFVIHLPAQCVIVPLTIFAQVALTHHTTAIMDGADTTIRQSIQSAMRKWYPILLWSGLTLVVNMLYKEISYIQYHAPLELSLSILGLIWMLLTLFVPTAIALEELSPLEYLAHSIIVVRIYLFKILGGLFWIALIFLICIVPFNGLWLVAKVIPGLYYSVTFMHLINSLELCIQWIISSANAIFKTIIYLHHKEGLEELEQLRYPRM